MALVERLKIRLFQSTLPARGATQKVIPSVQVDADFNPRSPHGERHRARRRAVWAKAFQSTLPARGATLLLGEQVCGRQISIHAPRTGSDDVKNNSCYNEHISIHAPRTGSDATAAAYLS